MINDDVKDQFNVKALVAFMIHRDSDLQFKALTQLGLIESGKDKKLTYLHTSVNKKAPTEINHHLSPHTQALQRSKYICVDNDLSKAYLLGANSK